jgi:phosphoribosylanthranilate isomerase
VLIQIYGLTDPSDMRRLAELDIDNVGVVLEEGYGTWDAVDQSTARRICDEVPDAMTLVGLSLHTEPRLIQSTAEALRPAIVHIVKAESMSDATLAEVRDRLAPAKTMLTVPMRDRSAVEIARRLGGMSDYLLLDTAHPTSGQVGATGHTHDWMLSRQVVEAVDVPVVLAGGLGPHNVVEAIEVVRPNGVDSETRTSRDDDRRRKDIDKVTQLIERVRAPS